MLFFRKPARDCRVFFALLLVGSAGAGGLRGEGLDPGVRQLIVSIAPGWGSSSGTLQRYARKDSGGWVPVGKVVPALYGKNGLAWGRGELGADERGLHKAEGDGRAPAGIFALGPIYGSDAGLPSGADYPFHQVKEADAWIDDPKLPDYNQHVVVDLRNPPAWFEQERMRLNDPAYRWLVEIRHNAGPVVPGAGSAIFFHIRRGEARPTFGCTALAESDLREMIGWLRAADQPHYVLLPRTEYIRLWRAWGLPRPASVLTPGN